MTTTLLQNVLGKFNMHEHPISHKIRMAYTFTSDQLTKEEFVEGMVALGYARGTVLTQYSKAKREDEAIEALLAE